MSLARREDRDLEAALLAGLPGIPACAVRGCLISQAEGLADPEAVPVATQAYRDESDSVRRLVVKRCIVRTGLYVTAGELRAAYEAWCMEQGERSPVRSRAWSERLRDLGVEQGTARVMVKGPAMRAMYETQPT